MNNKSLKIIIGILLSIIVVAFSLYFYNEYRKKQALKNALIELAQDFNSYDQDKELDNLNIEKEPAVLESESSKTIEQNPQPQQFVESKPANCQIELAGRSIYNSKCNFQSSEGGSFTITGFDINQSLIGHVQEISVEIKEPNIATVFGSNENGMLHEWGQAKRSKGCWIGGDFKVCAYASDIKSKNSSVEMSNGKESVKQISKEEELEHVRKVLDEGDATPEVKAIVYCTRKAEIYHTKKDMQEIEFTNCLNSLNPNY
ncbi:hypothetical protein [Acinetobacter baumannii]|uniref:hypothetical protein n=1 Tax=Acinetobacter baumannii TaxID=470 RepID=UPI00178BAF8F|nr:hypothetical protein [Acinetobacter baumannii]QOJ62387.1 hypothetical protein H0529_21905 [Acinetobacter baumannii]